MEPNLLDLTTETLLEKFGAGNHKPGSGSAAAFQGMLSAKLLVTVISLTNEEKRRLKYNGVLPELLKMNDEIQNRIFLKLTELFHEDAIQFGKTITARIERDEEKDFFKHNSLARKALSELKKSIDIPFAIAKHCIRLAEISEFVFEKAFQAARGDSQVALSGSVAGLAGCLSIIQLNFLSFESDEYSWTSGKIEAAKKLKRRYIELNETANKKIEILEKEVETKAVLHHEVDKLLNEIKSKPELTDTDIEKAATDFQNLMWTYRTTVWRKNIPTYPAEVLKPSEVFKKALGYRFAVTSKIDNSPSSEFAGLINQDEKIVLISNNFENNTQNFTAAHELGHALLHKQTVMHRDRPIDGTINGIRRSIPEQQADKFATYFLMPVKLIVQVFQEIFGVTRFVINEDNTFNLVQHSSPSKLKAECENLRGLALKLASTEKYVGGKLVSLSNLFRVSITAMAIRLEELELVEF